MSKNDEIALPFYGSWKGRVIQAIAVNGMRTWDDILEATGLYPNVLKSVLAELFDKHAISKTKDGEYKVMYDLYIAYSQYFKEKTPNGIISPQIKLDTKNRDKLNRWIQDWANVKKIDVSFEHLHFFLEGRHLDDFINETISNASSEVLIINPFVNRCNTTEELIKVAKKGIKISLIMRSIDKSTKLANANNNYLKEMKTAGVQIIFHPTVHSKLVIIDRTVAIVSSMNLIPQSTGGQSLEAGLVSLDPKNVNRITDYVLEFFEKNLKELKLLNID